MAKPVRPDELIGSDNETLQPGVDVGFDSQTTGEVCFHDETRRRLVVPVRDASLDDSRVRV